MLSHRIYSCKATQVVGLYGVLDPRPGGSSQHFEDGIGWRSEHMDACCCLERLLVGSSSALSHHSHVILKRDRIGMDLHDSNLGTIVVRVFVECQEARFIRPDEVTQSWNSLSFGIELAFLQSVGRDGDERSRH
jgi:hypothetical protein